MRMVVEVPDELHERFRREARARGVAQSALIRAWISEWVGFPPESAPNGPETPLNGPERQRTVDEILRRSRKGR